MSHRKTSNPFAAYSWLTEAGFVFAAHSAQLWADPFGASARLNTLWAEKQKAFAEGAMKASMAAMGGASPEAVARAAMAPTRRAVRKNARQIGKG